MSREQVGHKALRFCTEHSVTFFVHVTCLLRELKTEKGRSERGMREFTSHHDFHSNNNLVNGDWVCMPDLYKNKNNGWKSSQFQRIDVVYQVKLNNQVNNFHRKKSQNNFDSTKRRRIRRLAVYCERNNQDSRRQATLPVQVYRLGDVHSTVFILSLAYWIFGGWFKL